MSERPLGSTRTSVTGPRSGTPPVRSTAWCTPPRSTAVTSTSPRSPWSSSGHRSTASVGTGSPSCSRSSDVSSPPSRPARSPGDSVRGAAGLAGVLGGRPGIAAHRLRPRLLGAHPRGRAGGMGGGGPDRRGREPPWAWRSLAAGPRSAPPSDAHRGARLRLRGHAAGRHLDRRAAARRPGRGGGGGVALGLVLLIAATSASNTSPWGRPSAPTGRPARRRRAAGVGAAGQGGRPDGLRSGERPVRGVADRRDGDLAPRGCSCPCWCAGRRGGRSPSSGCSSGALVLGRLVAGPGFVPGMIPTTPLVALGLVVVWPLRGPPGRPLRGGCGLLVAAPGLDLPVHRWGRAPMGRALHPRVGPPAGRVGVVGRPASGEGRRRCGRRRGRRLLARRRMARAPQPRGRRRSPFGGRAARAGRDLHRAVLAAGARGRVPGLAWLSVGTRAQLDRAAVSSPRPVSTRSHWSRRRRGRPSTSPASSRGRLPTRSGSTPRSASPPTGGRRDRPDP